MRRRSWVAPIALPAVAVATLWSGCGGPPPPYVPADREKPPQTHCFDGVPHIKGSTPQVLGGVCCCTPSDELVQILHADGICRDLDTAGLIALYHDKGIQLASDHQRCNNLCEFGPHVTKGGKCMVPPTPGTKNYEEVVTGRFFQPAAPDAPRK